jgi:hypothetical protein
MTIEVTGQTYDYIELEGLSDEIEIAIQRMWQEWTRQGQKQLDELIDSLALPLQMRQPDPAQLNYASALAAQDRARVLISNYYRAYGIGS